MGEGNICIGEIKGAHGVKGLVRLYVFADDHALFKTLKKVSISLKNKHKNNMWLAEVEGIHSKEAADALKGAKVYCERSALQTTKENEAYYADLIGMVCTDEAGQDIGTVIDVQNFGAGDILDIRPEKGGDSFYLGYTDDNILSVTDKILIRLPEVL